MESGVIETLQTVRFLVFYPLIAVSALFWSVLMWLRFRRLGLLTDFWSAQIGLAVSAWALLSIAALWVAACKNFGVTTAALVTLGTFLLATALTTAVLLTGYRLWRRRDV